MFGNTLSEVMELQREIFPERKIPWIQHTLSEQILLMQGKQTEGIFRVPADADEVVCLKAYVDKWEFPENKGTMGKLGMRGSMDEMLMKILSLQMLTHRRVSSSSGTASSTIH